MEDDRYYREQERRTVRFTDLSWPLKTLVIFGYGVGIIYCILFLFGMFLAMVE
jgi:hypothetical protein